MNDQISGARSDDGGMVNNSQPDADRSAEIRTISSDALLKGRTEVTISHDGDLYRLRRTSKGKLIMTK